MKTLESVLDTNVSSADMDVLLTNCVNHIKPTLSGADKIYLKNNELHLQVHMMNPTLFKDYAKEIKQIYIDEYCYFDNGGTVDGNTNFPKDIIMCRDDVDNFTSFDDISTVQNINIHANQNTTVAFNVDNLRNVKIENAFAVSIDNMTGSVRRAAGLSGSTKILHVALPKQPSSKDPENDINRILNFIPKTSIKYDELHLTINDYTYAISTSKKDPYFYVLIGDDADVEEYVVNDYHVYCFEPIEYIS